MKKSFVLLSLSGAFGLSALAASSFWNAKKGIDLNAACGVCSGYHYLGKEWNASSPLSYGKGANGLYEYWHCCQCHRYYFDKADISGGYDASKWEEAKVESKASTSDHEDDRVQFGGTKTIHKINAVSSSISVDGKREASYDSAAKYDFVSSGDAKATLEALYQGEMLYVYISVTDPTKVSRDCSVSDPSTPISSYDGVELYVDALHSEKLADDAWDGKEGGAYHKGGEEEEWSAVGKWSVSAGYAEASQCGEGCEFDDSYSLSSACKGDGKTSVKSVYSDDGHYGVEFAIDLGKASTPLNDFGEIGIAAKVNDVSAKGVVSAVLPFESINEDASYVRNYSAFRLSGYKANEEGFDLTSGQSLVDDIQGSSWGFGYQGNKISMNSTGSVLGSSSYTDFTVLLQFDGISTDSNINVYFGKTARKVFLFGGDFDANGKYQGYGLSASTTWIEIIQVSGTAGTFIGGYNVYAEGMNVRLTVKDGVATLTHADGTAMENPFGGLSSVTLSGYSGGKLGALRNDEYASTLTIAGLSSDVASTSSDEASGVALVSEMKENAKWNFTGNHIALKSNGYRLSSSSYSDFSAVLEFENISRDASVNPFLDHNATKAFLFGGSVDANGNYQGYALHFSKDWIEILEVSGYTTTFVDGYGIDGESIKVKFTVSGTSCALSYADGTSMGNTYNSQTSIALSKYAGGKVGAMRNDTFASVLSVYEFKA